MSDPKTPRNPKRATAIILGILVLVIAGVTGMGVLATAERAPASEQTPAAASTDQVATATIAPVVSPTASAPATAAPTPTSTPSATKRVAVPTPQPTKTAAIATPTAVPIKKELTATVVKSEAVAGKADGPGEIGGPSVRFTIRITNTTGAAISLSSTVVNAYYGSAATPAVQLRMPGGVDFPTSVADGSSATGVFLFNIPSAGRSDVKVTVDTSVQNPVIAFQGSAPRG